MQLFAYIANTFKEISGNKLRTFLSVLGISIGIFCIIAVFTMIDSFKKNLDDSLSGLGDDIVYVNKFAWMPEEGDKEYEWWRYKARPQAKQKELRRIKSQVPAIAFGSMLAVDNTELTYQDNKIDNIRINAIGYEFSQLQNFELENGRYFSKKECEGLSNAAIIGGSLVEEIFGRINPIGKSIKLFGRPYTIIGTLKKRGKDIIGFDFDKSALISYRNYCSFKNPEDDLNEFGDNTMMLRINNKLPMEDALLEIKGNLRAQRRIKPGERDNFSLNILSSVQDQINGIFIVVNLAGFLIGFFSLLVGAFGIANIMFVTVKERTSQIGLKKALGAKPSVILIEYLLEAVILSVLGGLIGIALVLLGAFFINLTGEFDVFFTFKNFLWGVGISSIVGLLAGYIPARRAAKLSPIVAIRS